jgi:hypothetical protein
MTDRFHVGSPQNCDVSLEEVEIDSDIKHETSFKSSVSYDVVHTILGGHWRWVL